MGHGEASQIKGAGKGEGKAQCQECYPDHLEMLIDNLSNFAIHTNLPRSEICGLKWDAIDLVENRLRVVSTLHSINGHGLVSAEPKTKKSRRTIVLAPETVKLLHGIKGSQIERGLPTNGEGYGFTRPNGSPLIPQEVTKAFTGFVRAHNLPHMTFHGLRHA